jgi:hypothetical protein
LNREWVASEFKITTGFVSSYFFADSAAVEWSPRIGADSTLMTLHNAAHGHPKATWESPKEIPYTTTCEISRMTGGFRADVTLNRPTDHAAFAGDLFQEHAAARGSATQCDARR